MPDFSQYRWTVQQDGAPSNTAKNTINYLKRENVSFIEPPMWPPNSPDLNPVDVLFGMLFSSKSSITENVLLSIS